jgi:hypothetical protein
MLIVGVLTIASTAIAGPATASTQVGCYGTVACTGQSPITSGCSQSGDLIEDKQVANLGDVDFYESPICGTAWATLTVTNIYVQPPSGPWPELAEIFFVPPQGGPEQFQAVEWTGNTADVATTLMVPDSGSAKACAGDPADTTHPFDEDPLSNGVTQDQNQNPTFYTTGACTLWH